MDIKTFANMDQAKEFIATLVAAGKSYHIVETSFINVVYNY